MAIEYSFGELGSALLDSRTPLVIKYLFILLRDRVEVEEVEGLMNSLGKGEIIYRIHIVRVLGEPRYFRLFSWSGSILKPLDFRSRRMEIEEREFLRRVSLI